MVLGCLLFAGLVGWALVGGVVHACGRCEWVNFPAKAGNACGCPWVCVLFIPPSVDTAGWGLGVVR